MESPCINVCVIDANTGLCAGCGRTIEEIAAWSAMTDDERRRILLALPDRRRQAPPAADTKAVSVWAQQGLDTCMNRFNAGSAKES